jgi:hypothetical protein
MGWRWAVVAAVAAVALPLLIVVFVFAQPPVPASGAGDATPSQPALADIPPSYLRWYMDAAQTCPGLSWTVLAAVGKVESDHGRDPAFRRPKAAGARGPMQFLPATFAAYAVDGNGDGRTDIYDPADASTPRPPTCAPPAQPPTYATARGTSPSGKAGAAAPATPGPRPRPAPTPGR